MTFDSTPAIQLEVEIIDKILDILSTPDRWCKDQRVKGQSFCLIGARTMVFNEYSFGERTDHAKIKVAWALRQEAVRRNFRGVVHFNDFWRTTHSDVIDFLMKVRESLATS